MSEASDSETPNPSEDLLDGELPVGGILVDRYQILQRLSAGGMGVVYKAKHLALDDIVAIKLLLKPQDETDRKRFLLEARLATKIKHPNTVYVSDFGLLPDGRTFLVMEYMNGETLSSALKKGPMEPLRACRIAVQIARGLQAVHDQNIVHRDLKPDNIFLLTQDGQSDFVKIVDFGIAKAGHLPASAALERQESSGDGESLVGPGTEGTAKLREALKQLSAEAGPMTMKSAILGTPRYMSPEAIKGKTVDGRADQYSLGCVLFQLLTGQLPFREDDLMALLTQHMYEPIPDLRVTAPEVPPAIAQIVTKLLAKNPDDRYGSMRELEQALDREIEIILVQRGERAVITSALAGLLKVQGKGLGAVVMIAGRAIPLWAMAPVALLLIVGGAGLGVRFFAPKLIKESLRPGELRALRAQALTALRADLKAGPIPIRRGAVAALGLGRDRELQDDLVPLLADEDPQLRSQVAEALGYIGDRGTIPILKKFLASESTHIARLGAALALDQLGDPGGGDELTVLLSSGQSDVQLRAALSRCDRIPKPAQNILLKSLDRTGLPQNLRLPILGCLGRSGDDQAVAELRRHAHSQVSPAERIAAQAKLSELGDPSARSALQELVRKRGPDHLLAARFLAGPDEVLGRDAFRNVLIDPGAAMAARRLSAEGLGAIGELFDARVLGALLPTPQLPGELRQTFAAAILQIAAHDPALVGEDSLNWAATQLGDGSWLARQAAVAVLGDTRSAEARTLLARALIDPDSRVRIAAARALGRQSTRDVLSLLRVGLDDRDRTVRTEILRAIGRLAKSLYRDGASDLLPLFRTALQATLTQATDSEKALALSTLVTLGERERLPELLRLTRSAEPASRKLVVEALERQPDSLAEFVKDEDVEVRSLAAAELGALGDARAVPVLQEVAGRGDSASLTAIGVLGRMNQRATTEDELITLFGKASDSERLSAVSTAGMLPSELGRALLLRAARDPVVEIRHKVAEVAAELPLKDNQPIGASILHILVTDKDAAIRRHALALLGSMSRAPVKPTAAEEKAAATGGTHSLGKIKAADLAGAEPSELQDLAVALPTPPADLSTEEHSPSDAAGPADEGESHGLLMLEGPDFMELQVDHHKWQSIPNKPLRLPIGTHHIVTLSEVHSVHIHKDRTSHLVLKPSAVETTTRDGIELYEKQQYDRALRLLERAFTGCERTHGKQHKGCGPLLAEIAYHKGLIFSAQDRADAAATEYQRVVDSERQGGRGESFRGRAKQSLDKLVERLGLIVFKQQTSKGCQQEKLWVHPGNPVVKLGGEERSVRIRARQTIELGACE